MIYSLSEAAAVAGVSPKTVRKAIAEGRLPAERDNDKARAPFRIAPHDLAKAFPASTRHGEATTTQRAPTTKPLMNRRDVSDSPVRQDIATLRSELDRKAQTIEHMLHLLRITLQALERAGALEDIQRIKDELGLRTCSLSSTTLPPEIAAVLGSMTIHAPDPKQASQPGATAASSNSVERIVSAQQRLDGITTYVRKLFPDLQAHRS